MSDEMAAKSEADCEVCGEGARVRVLEGYVAGEPSFRLYCLTCIETATTSVPKAGPQNRRERLGLSSLMIVAGLGLGLLSVLADELGLEGSAGFGRKQTVGALVGGLLIVIGALAHVDLLAMFGVALFGLSLIVDVVRVGLSPGVGIKQAAAIVIAFVTIVIGVWLRRRRKDDKQASVQASDAVQSGSTS